MGVGEGITEERIDFLNFRNLMKLSTQAILLSIIISSLYFVDIKAQDKSNKTLIYNDIPLKAVLEDLESRYQIKFSYISEIVNDQKVSGKFSNSDLEELVKRILDRTDITYQFIDDKNIILHSKNQPKIRKKVDKASYSLKGKITNGNTKEPVAFASIVIGDSGKGTVTDLNGRFEIGNLMASRTKVFVNMVGFKKVEETLNLDSDQIFDIELEEAFVELEGIEITPGLFSIQSAEPKPHQLSSEEITYSPNFARDIYRTLSLVPGVANTEYTAKARIRGGHSDETALYIDNFEIYEPYHMEEFDGVFSVINTDFVEETKVLTGGFSPRYTDKISGIVSVKTPDNISQTETKISLDIINASIMRKQKISPKSSAFFGARRGYIDFLLNQSGGIGKPGIEPVFYDVWGKYNYQINRKNLFTYNVMFSYDKTFLQEHAVIREDFFDSKRKGFYNWLNWKWLPNNKFYTLTTLGYQILDKESDFRFESSLSEDNIDNRNTKIFIINQNSIWDFHPDHCMEFGVEFKKYSSAYRFEEERTNRINSTIDSTSTDKLNVDSEFDGYTIAAYLQESYNLTPSLTVMSGVRLSGQDFSETITLGPRTALSYQLYDKLKMNLAYGIYFQPDNFQKTRSFIGQEKPFEKSSKSIHYTGSLNYKATNTDLLLNVYFKDNKRLFDDYRFDFFNRFSGFGKTDAPFNTASGTSKGFEFSARHQLQKRHLLSATYRFSKDRIKNDLGVETYRDFDRRHSITINNVFKFKKNFSVSTLWAYHSGEPFTAINVELIGESIRNDDTRIVIDVAKKNSGRLPSYHTLNLKVEKSWILKKIEINAYLNIVNFYNRVNVRNNSFVGNSNSVSGKIMIGTGQIQYFNRFVTPGISVTF